MREKTLVRVLNRYEQSPHLVFWETTKACSLACAHCRASAQLGPLPGELSTEEGLGLIDQVADLEGPSPILVFTGGDCFARGDLSELLVHARSRGLRVGIAPSVTDQLTRERLEEYFALGVRSVSISLDGSNAASHDSLRGVPGHFDKTIDALRMMSDMGFRLQVNTTVMRRNAGEMAGIFALLGDVGVSIWEVFFLVGVGRGADVDEVDPRDAEDVCHFLVDAAAYGMTVRTVEAPFFRRVQVERSAFGGDDPSEHFNLGPLYGALRAGLEHEGTYDATRRNATLATGDGRGIIFVGFDGDVLASGFLPLSLGNIRTESLASIYTKNPLLKSIRAGELEGECARCDYSRLCGGSRARAFARTGRALGDDPSCIRTRPRRQIAFTVGSSAPSA